MEVGKKKLTMNVVSKKIDHKGFGAGSIDLSNLSSIIIDGDQAYLDAGAIHAKSKVEKGIKFSMDKSLVPNGRICWIIWVAIDRDENGSFYGGVTACEMLIDTEARKGWKILAEHVNLMDSALKRRFIMGSLGEKEKGLLKQLLIDHNLGWWERSPQELKDALN